MKRATKRASTARRKGKSGGKVSFASKILHQQKEDYKKIFRAEVKKASTPQEGARRAGRIYRERYGSTAEARWKRALQRAK